MASSYETLFLKNRPQLVPGEVLDVFYSDEIRTYQFAIQVRPYDQPSGNKNSYVLARPLNPNIKHIPIIGETVLLINTISPYGSKSGYLEDTYYISIVNLQGNIHHNGLPGASALPVNPPNATSDSYQAAANGNPTSVASSNNTYTIDENFPDNPNVKSLHPYLGDVMVEGRFGSSIRLSSTQQESGLFKLQPLWSTGDGQAGDPIIVIRNTSNHKATGQFNDFVTENLTDDSTDIVISSTQQINFTPAVSIPTVLQNAGVETDFIGNQVILSSGRIILNAKEKDVTILSSKAVGIATDQIGIDASKMVISSDDVRIGANANEPLLLGNQWKSLMSQLINALGTLTVTVPTVPGPVVSAPLITSPSWGNVAAILNQLDNALSSFAYTSKTNG